MGTSGLFQQEELFRLLQRISCYYDVQLLSTLLSERYGRHAYKNFREGTLGNKILFPQRRFNMRFAILSLLFLGASATEFLDRNLAYRSPFVAEHPEVPADLRSHSSAD